VVGSFVVGKWQDKSAAMSGFVDIHSVSGEDIPVVSIFEYTRKTSGKGRVWPEKEAQEKR
jgi:hypothetical protein